MATKLMDKLSKSSIRTKLTLVFALTMVLVVIINLFMQVRINGVIGTIDEVYGSNVSLNDLLASLDEVQDNMYSYLSTKSTDALDSYYRSNQNYRAQTDGLNMLTSDNYQKLSEKNIKSISGRYLTLTEEAVNAKRGRDVESYSVLYDEATELYRYLKAYTTDLNNRQFQNNSENYGVLHSSLKYVQTFSTTILISAIVADIIVLWLLSGTITRPLTKLARQSEQVGRGDFDIDFIEVNSNDEVGVMANAFNKMIKSLNAYVEHEKEQIENESRLKENQLRMENGLKEAQLIFLQSQINPHFLYNTLNAGEQLAMMEGAEKTCLFIEKLADFFRYNVKRTGETSTLGEEIEQVETYLHIINVRFSNEIEYTKTINAVAADGVIMPGVVLQPLVENAINHGLHETLGKKAVSLSVRDKGARLEVTVTDNGRGMTEQEIDAVLNGSNESVEERPQGKRSTGIRNVIERLQLFYGVKDVFSIVSDGLGTGTSVSIFIPKGEESENV